MKQTSGDNGRVRNVIGYWNDEYDTQFDWQHYVDAAQWRQAEGLRLLPGASPLSRNEEDHHAHGDNDAAHDVALPLVEATGSQPSAAPGQHDVALPLVEATGSQPSAAPGQQDTEWHTEDDKDAGEQAREACDSQWTGDASQYQASGTYYDADAACKQHIQFFVGMEICHC